MLTRVCRGTVPPAFVTRAGAGLVPSAGTRREELAPGDPSPATIPQALGHGCFSSVLPGVFGSLGAPSQRWHGKAGRCSAAGGRGIPSLGMLQEREQLPGHPACGRMGNIPLQPHPRALRRGRRRMLSSPRAGQLLSVSPPTEAPVTQLSQTFARPGPGGTHTFNSPHAGLCPGDTSCSARH